MDDDPTWWRGQREAGAVIGLETSAVTELRDPSLLRNGSAFHKTFGLKSNVKHGYSDTIMSRAVCDSCHERPDDDDDVET